MKPVTIKQAATHFAGTGLTESAIRRAVVSGTIPSVRVGSKYLLLIENIERWLHGEFQPKADSVYHGAGIRRVAE